MSKDLNGYTLSRNWFDWAFENPEKINPSHSAIYFFAIEHCNRLGWKEKFRFPTQMAMDALGIKNHSTYIKYFNELVEWGFINLIEKSKNQYSANIISLMSAVPKNNKALSRATGKALCKANNEQLPEQTTSNPKSTESIYKPENQVTKEPENERTGHTPDGDFSPPVLMAKREIDPLADVADEEEWKQYLLGELRYSPEFTQHLWDHLLTKGWKKGEDVIQDWRAYARLQNQWNYDFNQKLKNQHETKTRKTQPNRRTNGSILDRIDAN